VNEAVHHHLKRRNPVRAKIIYSCPAITEIPKIQPIEAKTKLGLDGRFVVLFSGWVRQDYDFDIILEAARELERSHLTDIIFVFIGPSEAMRPLIKAVTDAGVRGFFDFRGWVPDGELLTYYLASDLCYAVTRDLGPSTKVLTPIKMFESMACGVPVIVRDGTLAAEILRCWRCGIVLDPGSSFAHELIRLKQNKDELRALGAAGLNAFHHLYNWNLMEARLVELYTELENSIIRKGREIRNSGNLPPAEQ
jgi:glycosyltransferase involved in cell wall biosynthesis